MPERCSEWYGRCWHAGQYRGFFKEVHLTDFLWCPTTLSAVWCILKDECDCGNMLSNALTWTLPAGIEWKAEELSEVWPSLVVVCSCTKCYGFVSQAYVLTMHEIKCFRSFRRTLQHSLRRVASFQHPFIDSKSDFRGSPCFLTGEGALWSWATKVS